MEGASRTLEGHGLQSSIGLILGMQQSHWWVGRDCFPTQTGRTTLNEHISTVASLTGEEDMVLLAVLEAGIHYLGRLSELQAQFAKERSKAENSAS